VGTLKASAAVAAVVAAAGKRSSARGGDDDGDDIHTGLGGSGTSGGGSMGGGGPSSGGGSVHGSGGAFTSKGGGGGGSGSDGGSGGDGSGDELTTWSAHMAWLGRGPASAAVPASFHTIARYPEHRLEGVDAICCAVDSLSDRRAADNASVRHRYAPCTKHPDDVAAPPTSRGWPT
jgi:hypothetical protein